MKKITPGSFDEVYSLYNKFISRAGRNGIDEKSAFWIISAEAWDEMRRSIGLMVKCPKRTNLLMNIPVRLTANNAPGTPMIQLMMKPIDARGLKWLDTT